MNNDYKIRSFFIFILFCAAYLIIIVHLYSLQILQHDFFESLAKNQHTTTITINPPRGIIYDRHGTALAVNKDSVAAFLLPKNLESPERVERFLKKHFPKALERLHAHRDTHFIYIKRKLSPEEIELIEKSDIADIKLLHEPNRFYPYRAAGQIVGITDIDNAGQFGIEAAYNSILAGKPATVSLEKDARSGYFYFAKETKVEGHDAASVTLTLDADLQFLVREELKDSLQQLNAKEGAALVLDPANGDILAAVSYPDFDPNDVAALDLDHTRFKIVTDCYELGSVMKTFVTLGLFEDKLIDPEELIDCENVKIGFVNGMRISTWKAHGLLTFAEVIQLSNNIGAAKTALRLGPKLYDHYIRLGFGSKTALNWPGEQSGFVNPPSKWSKPSLNSLSFGYEITASLLQLARAFCLIANDGVMVEPHLLLKDPVKKKKLYDEQAVQTLKTILEKTVTEGTAHRARLKGYRVMGKTGTANMVIDGEYNKSHNIYTFARIIQKDDYQRLIIAFVKDIGHGDVHSSSVAVPIFDKIAQALLIHDKILRNEERV